LAGSAGRGIHLWIGGPIPPNSYLQRVAAGAPCSAAYLATNEGCTFLGATHQLVGEAWCNAAPFAYCGSIGPLPLGPEIEGNLAAAGERCMRAFGLVGLFGIDFLLDDSIVRPVEINPRYTASMEIFERASEVSFYELHRTAFDARFARPAPKEPTKVVGKAILFARNDCRVSFRATNLQPFDGAYADLPADGQQIPAGEPVLTILAEGQCEGECLQQLKRLVGEFETSGCMPICG
jgi:predicted ATP-grasp superfamily ATP-dependent carboligase